MSTTWRSICVIRLDSLGDTLLSTPALVSLRQNWPDARLSVITHSVGSPILRPLAEVLEVPPTFLAAEIAEKIRFVGADAVLLFTEKRRAAHAAWLAKTERRIGFDPGWTQPLKSLSLRLALTDRVPFPNDPAQDAGYHEVERYGLLVKALGGTFSSDIPLQLPVPRGPDPEGPLALQLTQKWLPGGWTEDWLRLLGERMPRPLVGFVSPAEEDWARRTFAGHPLQLAVYSDVLDYAWAFARCRALVTIDTGAAHVAAAVGLPVVDVFPELHNEHCVRRWRPWRVPHRVVLKPNYTSEAGDLLLERVLEALGDL